MPSLTTFRRAVVRLAAALGAVLAAPAFADNGIIVFGATNYGGAPNVGAPTWINNNFNGRQDVLSSPGLGSLGGYLTANPVVANNISQVAGNLPLNLTWFGGNAPLSGAPFGAGAVQLTSSQVRFALRDTAPGAGTASYGIASWDATYTVNAGYVGTLGNWLGIAGSVPQLGNAAVASLRTFLTGGIFGAGLDLNPLVLAASNNGAAGYNRVAQGGVSFMNAAGGAYRGFAYNSINVNIPAGTVFTARSTLTMFADPASIDSLNTSDIEALFNDPSQALPGFAVGGSGDNLAASVPEPGSAPLLLAGALMLAALARARGRR